MDYVITATSTYVDSFLQEEHTGTIHSVYRNTVNIVFGDALFALQSKGSPLSPVSLISSLNSTELAALHLVPGQSARLCPNELTLNTQCASLCFQYAPAEIYNSLLFSKAKPIATQKLKEDIAEALIRSHIAPTNLLYPFSSKEPATDNIMIAAARTRIKQCTTLLNQQSYEQAAKTLSGLIGLGMGLTPSGDDFLCGVFAGIIYLNLSSHPFSFYLAELVRRKLNDTNDISKTFLNCALLQQFSKAVTHLFTSPSSQEISERFQEIGHSSGMDTLSGVLWTLELGI